MSKSKKMKAAAIFVSLAAFGGTIPGVAGAQSEERVDCTVRTARQMTSIEDICVCNTVTTGMVNYIRRRPDFSVILEGTNEMCPALAAILVDVNVASVPVPEDDDDDDQDRGRPGGDGDDDDNGDGGNGGGGGQGGDGDRNKGHGNDPDGVDEDNPGKAKGRGKKDCAEEPDPSDVECDDGNRGHGKDPDGVDEDNPGASGGTGK